MDQSTTGRPTPVTVPGQPGPVSTPRASSSAWHDTVPITGPGPEAFAAPPVLPSSSGKAEPIAPPVGEAPKPPPTPEEVAPMAIAFAMYFEAGILALLATHGDELGKVVSIDLLVTHLPKARDFVRGSAERVAIKYGIRGLPYQDEIICVGAVGVATFGFFGKPKKPGDKDKQAANENAQRVTQPPPNAKNANVNANANANANANGHNPSAPLPETYGDFKP